jgi:UDP-N-acetylglucosamine--N-acetylmuramyl-(pentapeptide) pyrophosphoryl-undecaprenol N-acetylglucosamine transferase
MRIILAGGGTGGHIYPAITIAREFMRRDPQTEILFIGGKRGLEAELIPKEGFRLVTLQLEGIPRRLSLKVFKSLGLAGKGIGETYKIMKKFRPDLVIGTGGYVCGPAVMTAALMGIPTAIQEQNAFPGLTNRLLGKVVKRVFLAYSEAGKYFNAQKVRIYGNPIRTAEFLTVSRPIAERNMGIQPDRLNLLVFGGSQSARRINQCLLEILAKVLREFPHLQIIMMTGLKDYESVQAKVANLDIRQEHRARLFLAPYFYKIADAYSVSDLILARAGAISLAEITYFGIPALLVPYPFATNNHQEFNARVLEKNNAAQVLLEKDLTPETLWSHLALLLKDADQRHKMASASKSLGKPNATEDIVNELIKIVPKRV